MNEPSGDEAAAVPTVQVIGKAVAVLECFEDGPPELTLAEISRRVALNRSTVYRVLATLCQHGLVERTTSGGYKLGLRLFELGSLVQKRLGLRAIALPYLTSLAETLGATAFLSVRDGDRAVCVERVDRGGVTISTYQVGETLPLYSGASPVVLLASLPPSDRRAIIRGARRPSDNAALDPRDIERAIEAVQTTGIAVSDGDVHPAMAALGTAIRDGSGQVIAAIAVSELRQTILGADQATVEGALRQAAAAIERSIVTHGLNGR